MEYGPYTLLQVLSVCSGRATQRRRTSDKPFEFPADVESCRTAVAPSRTVAARLFSRQRNTREMMKITSPMIATTTITPTHTPA